MANLQTEKHIKKNGCSSQYKVKNEKRKIKERDGKLNYWASDMSEWFYLLLKHE